MTASPPTVSATNSAQTVRRPLWREPVVGWAVVGLLFTFAMVWVLGRWALDGGIHSVDSRPYAISTTRKAVLWGLQGVFVTGFIALTVYYVRQYRRERKVRFEACLLAALVLMSWTAPLFQYDGRVFLVNKYLLNVATWGPYLPGWDSPNPEHQLVGVLTTDGVGWWPVIIWFYAARWGLDRICNRRRAWSRSSLIAVTTALCLAVELVVEPLWILSGAYVYAAADPTGFAFFAGHWYQLPLIEVIMMAAWIVPFVVMDRLARDSDTDAVILHGSARLSARTRPWAQLLAVTGLATLLMVAYELTLSAVLGSASTHLNPDLPSYFLPDGG